MNGCHSPFVFLKVHSDLSIKKMYMSTIFKSEERVRKTVVSFIIILRGQWPESHMAVRMERKDGNRAPASNVINMSY